MPLFILKNSEYLKTQYDLTNIVERQCSYCSYAFALFINELLPNINLREKSLNKQFIENYNKIIEVASYVKKTSPYVMMMETFNSEYSQKCFNIYPELSHMVLNPQNLEDYEPMHDLYRSQFVNWQQVHEAKLRTPKITISEFKTLLADLINPTSNINLLIINRFFMTFLIVPITKTLNKLKHCSNSNSNSKGNIESRYPFSDHIQISDHVQNALQRYSNKIQTSIKCDLESHKCDNQLMSENELISDTNMSTNNDEYLILDSHYKSVYILSKNDVLKYVDSKSDYNLVLIGKIYDTHLKTN
jgi:hypothetical protein